MNKKTPQIPGKLFYDMASRKQIVVLSDGPMQEEIITYLKKYRRFAICKNRVKDIRELLHTQMDIVPNIDYAKACFSPSAIAQQLLSGGLDL